jgi:adenylate cyclase class 2
MPSSIEREIKLRYRNRHEAEAAIESIQKSPHRDRRLQDDRLLDLPEGNLRQKQCTLRVRVEKFSGGHTTASVTFKGPPQQDIMKVREEIETTLADGDTMLRIFQNLGWRVWFRYQKYREEFITRDNVIVALDETPIGMFVELEGTKDAVAQLAQSLAKTSADYISASYRKLYETDCMESGRSVSHMVFKQ